MKKITRLADEPPIDAPGFVPSPVDEASRFFPVSDEVNAAPTPVATPRSSFLRLSMINLSARWALRFRWANYPMEIWELSGSRLVAKTPNRIGHVQHMFWRASFRANQK